MLKQCFYIFRKYTLNVLCIEQLQLLLTIHFFTVATSCSKLGRAVSCAASGAITLLAWLVFSPRTTAQGSPAYN